MKDKSLNENKTPSFSKPKKKYRKYSYAFKREVVYQVTSGKMYVEQARKHFNINGKTVIYTWIKKYGLLFYNPNKSYEMKQSPQERIKELLKKIEELEADKELLLTTQQVLMEDFNLPVKKYLPELLEKDLKKHIKKNKKKD